MPFRLFQLFMASEGGPVTASEMLMSVTATNVIPFPLNRERTLQGCPRCGKRTSVWRIGRLAWAYCEAHAVRWVAADLKTIAHGKLDRQQLRKGLEFLSAFAEVSR
jgi:hypothetical protein